MESIFKFIDYRRFLEQYYTDKKKNSRYFSYRYFATKTGINSPSFLKHVIDGKRNLTDSVVEKFCVALNLNKKESLYFRHLVLFNQAKTSIEKQEHYTLLRTFCMNVKESVLGEKQLKYFDTWYSVILRELVCLYNFKDDYKMISQAIIPNITIAETKTSINTNMN